ncbi:MAG: hypothetical protein ABJH68_17015 [Ilumatobacter sp.]|uniref:hypothetical protein n=2 Tax=Ilumatobacter sp. TaxID=1967498 RepID=UPI003299CA63
MRSTPILDRPERRRTVGRVMIAVAAVGVVVALVGSVVAWQLVGSLDDSSRQTLDVTIDTIDSIEASLDLAAGVLLATNESVDAAAASLDSVDESLGSASGVIGEIDDLTEVVGPALEDAGTTLRELEGVGDGIDSLLGDLSNIPFGPDYDPEQGLGDTIGDLAAEIELLPEEFEQTSSDLDDFETDISTLRTDVTDLATAVGEVSDQLDGSDVIIAGYRTNLADARAVAVSTRDDLGGNVGLMRVILLIGGLNLAIGQIVPFWIGRTLLAESEQPGSGDLDAGKFDEPKD